MQHFHTDSHCACVYTASAIKPSELPTSTNYTDQSPWKANCHSGSQKSLPLMELESSLPYNWKCYIKSSKETDPTLDSCEADKKKWQNSKAQY